jgi:hypothetical protein
MLLSVLLLAFTGCSRDDAPGSVNPAGEIGTCVPHFYGIAMPEGADTRGVAVTTKVWSKPIAEKNLTVKFLNGTERYRELVREAAKEWEKNAGVRFFFVDDAEDAMIRVGFDFIPGMMSSWALTGTDHLQAYSRQSEPTVHFAQWRRASDALKRSDVLRAFGQVLGLQLEFRHPKFHPNWITDENGNLDEARIRTYWENELAGYISWDELKKVVLDPIADPSFLVAKTADYDPLSVMNWPFYEMMADNIPPIEFDEDYKTELSEKDKQFIEELYGPSFNGMPLDDEYLPLVEFEYTGTGVGLYLTTTKNLVIIWDKDAKLSERIDLPSNSTSAFSQNYSYYYEQAGSRKIIIGEMLERGQERPDRSTALLKLELRCGSGTGDILVEEYNDALESFLVMGGKEFRSRTFDFTGYKNLREIYLVGTLDSRLIVKDCPKLETLATSQYIWRPPYILDMSAYGNEKPEEMVSSQADSRVVGIGWPINAQGEYSLSDLYGPGLVITNCKNIKAICLENTRLKQADFSNLPNLEYVYLSSAPDYLVGGGRNDRGDYLYSSALSLTNRTGKTAGVILLRGVGTIEGIGGYLKFQDILLTSVMQDKINRTFANSNWTPYWNAPYRR